MILYIRQIFKNIDHIFIQFQVIFLFNQSIILKQILFFLIPNIFWYVNILVYLSFGLRPLKINWYTFNVFILFLCVILLTFTNFFFFFYSHTCSLGCSQGQGSNQNCNYGLCHSCGTTGSELHMQHIVQLMAMLDP